jgi:hypothetical protein
MTIFQWRRLGCVAVQRTGKQPDGPVWKFFGQLPRDRPRGPKPTAGRHPFILIDIQRDGLHNPASLSGCSRPLITYPWDGVCRATRSIRTFHHHADFYDFRRSLKGLWLGVHSLPVRETSFNRTIAANPNEIGSAIVATWDGERGSREHFVAYNSRLFVGVFKIQQIKAACKLYAAWVDREEIIVNDQIKGQRNQ